MNNTKTPYPKVESNTDYGLLENKISKYWQENNIFKKSVDFRPTKIDDKSNEFTFYDGPPFANGLPHYGHLLTGFIKDVYARYQTIKGKKVERKFGWDCHGLPAEMAAEKDLSVSGRSAIIKYGVGKFNNHCKSLVLKYTNAWEEYVDKQGRWVDIKNAYKTMDTNFMESIIWAFKELYNKGYIYKAMRVMPYSWACQTPLSNFETRLDNSYRQRADNSVSVLFESAALGQFLNKTDKVCYFVSWTTTPWTLPSNLALALGEKIEYVAIELKDKCYVMSSEASKKFMAKELNGGLIIAHITGKELEILSYTPIFDYFKDHSGAFKTLCGDFVTGGDGTGIVHIAPGFGEDDFLLCKQHNIELVCPVDNAGNFTNEIPDLEGINVLESNDKVIIKLKNQGNWLATEQYLHNYPHCWRTDTPLIYKAVSSWYLKVTDFKDRMVEHNKKINWIPNHIRDGLFGNWLENAKDWNISRNRFWGTPIPVWMSDDPNYPRIDVYGSISEIEKDFGVKVTDLHKEHLDELVRINPDDPSGKSIMRRVEDVFDCWFESGSMPYAQMHYPFENKEYFEQNGPADFIVEYVAQTRGWFYTLMVLSTALFDRPPFLNCICHGVILDVKGQKLSKRLNNYADPLEIIAKYGSDALRLTMLSSSVAKGEELLIDKDGHMVFEALRLHIRPIWQAYHFFTIYANIDNINAKLVDFSENILDKYILAKLKTSVSNIEKSMEMFDSQSAYAIISDFFEILNNWYIRRSRNRFWGSENDVDKVSAYDTLYTCLVQMSKAFSPLLPFLSEELYLNLTSYDVQDNNRSVHLENFPKLNEISNEEDLVAIMDIVRDICSTGLFIRNKENIRSRQPLQKLTIVIKDYAQLQKFEHLIKDELNVKEIIYADNLSEYGTYKLSLNHSTLAKRLSNKMKDLIAAAKNNAWKIESKTLFIAGENLNLDEYSLLLEPIVKGANKSLSNNDGIVLLDITITRELFLEGIAKDVIRTIQQMRKEANLNIEDRIIINIGARGDSLEAITIFESLIEEQTLSNIQFSEESSIVNYIFKNSIEYMDDKLDFIIVAKM